MLGHSRSHCHTVTQTSDNVLMFWCQVNILSRLHGSRNVASFQLKFVWLKSISSVRETRGEGRETQRRRLEDNYCRRTVPGPLFSPLSLLMELFTSHFIGAAARFSPASCRLAGEGRDHSRQDGQLCQLGSHPGEFSSWNSADFSENVNWILTSLDAREEISFESLVQPFILARNPQEKINSRALRDNLSRERNLK